MGLISLLLAVSSVQAKQYHHGFNKHSLKGTFAYLVTGSFGPSGLSNTFAEMGLFTANGHGRITATATSRVDGVAADVEYDCEYDVDSDGTAPVTCTRTTTDPVSEDESESEANFLLVLAAHKTFVQIMFVSSTNPGFEYASVTGSGQKQ